MGRKRKALKADIVAGEDNACREKTGVEHTYFHTHPKANDMENVGGLSSVDPNSMVGNVVIRRSGRHKKQILPEEREKEPVAENVNSSKGEASDHQKVGTVPNNERNLEEETTQNQTAPTVCGLSSNELNSMAGYAHVVVRKPGRPKKTILPEGREKEPVAENVNLVETSKGETSYHQKVGTVPNNERSLEKEATQNQTAPSVGGLSSNELNLLACDVHVIVRKPGRPKKTILPEGREQGKPNGTSKGETTDHQKVGTVPTGEGDLEKEATQNQRHMTCPYMCGRNFEQKLDYIKQAVDEIKSKNSELVTGRPNDSLSSDLNYKTLYIDSMKKIESLMEKHYELVKELEFARGKIDAYEKMSSAMASPKGVTLDKDSKDHSHKLTSVPDDPNADECVGL